MRARRQLALAAIVLVIVAAVLFGRVYLRGASLVVQAAGVKGWPRTLLTWHLLSVERQTISVPSRFGPVRADLYRPSGRTVRALVMVPGVHAAGIDEPRLVGFARDLASLGLLVLAVDIRELRQYRITPVATDVIEEAAIWLADRRDLAPDGRIGLMGISFGGGLALVAAARPSIRDRVTFALSLGGHADFPRTLRYLLTGKLPDGRRYPPHDYGVVLILLNVVDRLVPAAQAEALRRGILTFLEASHVDMVDKARARIIFQRARQLEKELPEPAAALLSYVNARNVSALGSLLLPHIHEYGNDPALSPARNAPPRASVYLLHGSQDNVIPSMESILLEERWRDQVRLRLLVTPIITHAELDRRAMAAEVWKLVTFWSRVLGE